MATYWTRSLTFPSQHLLYAWLLSSFDSHMYSLLRQVRGIRRRACAPRLHVQSHWKVSLCRPRLCACSALSLGRRATENYFVCLTLSPPTMAMFAVIIPWNTLFYARPPYSCVQDAVARAARRRKYEREAPREKRNRGGSRGAALLSFTHRGPISNRQTTRPTHMRNSMLWKICFSCFRPHSPALISIGILSLSSSYHSLPELSLPIR